MALCKHILKAVHLIGHMVNQRAHRVVFTSCILAGRKADAGDRAEPVFEFLVKTVLPVAGKKFE